MLILQQVFDGHGGKDAAFYVKENVLQYILDDVAFPTAVEDAMKSAFLRLDDAFAKACSVDHDLSSGTTALTALLSGRFVSVFCSCLSSHVVSWEMVRA
jgi:protein phosphatase 2C family protein 2/3